MTFTDDYSRFGYIYLIKQKSDTFEKFKEFKNEVENQLGRKIKMLRSDRGGEYLSLEFHDYLKECGIVSQLTPPRTPQLNGVAERRNRTLLDMVRSMMSRASLPISFWGYALESAAHILNRVPTKKVAKTPHEMWTGKAPSLAHIKVWGCEAFVRRDAHDKLEPRSERCIFIGYPQTSFGYLFYR
ncbi:DDE-type integrase/transposase/recombinase, partial [Legionella pneumophila serogroup 1]